MSQTAKTDDVAAAKIPAVLSSSKNERELFKIASVSTALAFGAVLGSIQSLRHDASGFSFQLSAGTGLAFAIGAFIGFLYWKLVSYSETHGKFSLLRAASFLLLLGGVGAFLYPLRFLPVEKLPDVFKGLAIDVVALALLGLILWRIKRFLDEDSARNETVVKTPVAGHRPPQAAESATNSAGGKTL